VGTPLEESHDLTISHDTANCETLERLPPVSARDCSGEECPSWRPIAHSVKSRLNCIRTRLARVTWRDVTAQARSCRGSSAARRRRSENTVSWDIFRSSARRTGTRTSCTIWNTHRHSRSTTRYINKLRSRAHRGATTFSKLGVQSLV